jgi:hypothetical protein
MYCIVSYCVLCMYIICYLYTIVLTKVTRNKDIVAAILDMQISKCNVMSEYDEF